MVFLITCSPILESCVGIFKTLSKKGLDIFKMSISLPGISLHWAFNQIKNNEKFNLFAPKDADMAQVMQEDLTGVPSIVFHRCLLKGETPIHDNEGNILQTVVGFDAIVLYLWCTSLTMPMGKPCVYQYNVVFIGIMSIAKKMKLSFDPGVSEKQNAWSTDLCSVNFPYLRY